MKLRFFITRDRQTTRITRLLRTVGPTWAGSPVRRIIQALCLTSFLLLFLYVSWPYGGKDYSEIFAAKECVDVEIFLAMDPLVSISTAIAARLWVWSLTVAMVILGICLIFPRGFCGYMCPLGTLLDLFDWTLARRLPRFRLEKRGWWVNLRYFILAVVLVSAAFGVLLSGFAAAIAVLTRTMLMILAPVQTSLFKGRYLVPPMNAGHWISLALFAGLIGLSLVERRFWCKYLCPTGAVFSLGAMLSLTRRKVTADCIGCGQCEKVCDFAAIRDDFATRHARCSFCQSCGGTCPTGAIEFTDRWNRTNERPPADVPPTDRSRRAILAGLGTATAAGAGLSMVITKGATGEPPVRAPGSVLEEAFLQLCVRCGQCIKVCPNNVLQPAGLENGINGLWAPRVSADWSGCEPSCNNCGQACPTGAIRALSMEEKRATRMALAIVNKQTCLPHAGQSACRYCVDECTAAGYEAIEFIRVGGRVDETGQPIEGSGFLAPVVLEDKCVGCGLCQMRCRAMNVKNEHLLDRPAITIHAGPDREDRLLAGSYQQLHRKQQLPPIEPAGDTDAPTDDYLPDFLR